MRFEVKGDFENRMGGFLCFDARSSVEVQSEMRIKL